MNQHGNTELYWEIFSTALGWTGILADRFGIRRLCFGHPSEFAARAALDLTAAMPQVSPPDWWLNAQNLLVDYASGKKLSLNQVPVSSPQQTPFQQSVVAALRAVPYGETLSYAELATRAGAPRAARAVGNQMSRNPVPLLVPCHRVLGSGGKLGGFSAPQGLDMKRRLLAMEAAQSNA